MKNDGCGYDSCPCKGVNFISGGLGRTDYCVDGKRITLDDAGRVLSRSASAGQVEQLGLGLLARYAQYCIWHTGQVQRFGADFPALSPFGGSYPLERIQ